MYFFLMDKCIRNMYSSLHKTNETLCVTCYLDKYVSNAKIILTNATCLQGNKITLCPYITL